MESFAKDGAASALSLDGGSVVGAAISLGLDFALGGPDCSLATVHLSSQSIEAISEAVGETFQEVLNQRAEEDLSNKIAAFALNYYPEETESSVFLNLTIYDVGEQQALFKAGGSAQYTHYMAASALLLFAHNAKLAIELNDPDGAAVVEAHRATIKRIAADVVGHVFHLRQAGREKIRLKAQSSWPYYDADVDYDDEAVERLYLDQGLADFNAAFVSAAEIYPWVALADDDEAWTWLANWHRTNIPCLDGGAECAFERFELVRGRWEAVAEQPLFPWILPGNLSAPWEQEQDEFRQYYYEFGMESLRCLLYTSDAA
ncbi:MAG: hypothetical protein KUG77_28335, partial [Nannocystaceae bacterium]|nr:hypothetical protein [Nannocystaceae bacterium]